jgi:SAM-dependent methyltransferase
MPRMDAQDPTTGYYDALAPYYRLVYRDWEASVGRQAEQLDGVIREFFGPAARSLLDAACGIGTQALGLAALGGYEVTASDISPAALARAREEAAARNLEIEFRVADMRGLWEAHRREFDVVLAGDNAVPHLLSEADILSAFRQFRRCAAPGGGCIISVRDYASMERGGRRLYPRGVREVEGGRVVLLDVWDFEGDRYEITTYVIEDTGGGPPRTHVARGGRYWCVTIPVLERLLAEAGFVRTAVLADRFFQPLIVGVA